MNQEAMLEKLGFDAAAKMLKDLRARKRKLALAYEFYRFVRQEKVDAFNEALKKKTIKGSEPYTATWQKLSFTPIANYQHVPPEPVLQDLQAAVNRDCFDSFEIAHIREVKDPILFGRINDCSDRFFISQWDTDVSIDDLLNKNEG